MIFPFFKKEKNGIMEDERSTMTQWMNLHWNNSFVNRIQLPLLCEKSGAVFLVLMGLTAGRKGQQSDKYW